MFFTNVLSPISNVAGCRCFSIVIILYFGHAKMLENYFMSGHCQMGGQFVKILLVGRLGNGPDIWPAIDERPGLTNGV
jgi:hypothetical protein